ncbi:MAG: hypothetical protein RR733_04910 [Victivallaceae bacterium]
MTGAVPPADFNEVPYYNTTPNKDDWSFLYEEFQRDYWRSQPLIYPLWSEAYRDLQIYSGNQWDREQKKFLQDRRRNAFCYNRVMATIHSVAGYRANNPYGFQVNGVYVKDCPIADLYTDVLRHIIYKDNVYKAINEAIRSSMAVGHCFLSCWPDFRNDPYSGDVKVTVDYWNSVIFDPFFTERSLEDCSFIARRKYITKDAAAALLPESKEKIMSLSPSRRDEKFFWMPYVRQQSINTLVDYTEYWRREWRDQKVLLDSQNGTMTPWIEGPLALKEVLAANPQIRVITKAVKVVTLTVIIEDQVMFHKENPYGINRYPFVPFIAFFDPSNDRPEYRLQSFTRIMRDSQIEFNKRRSQMVDIIESQLNSGWINKENSVKNPRSFFETGQGSVITVKEGHSINESVQRITAPGIPESLFSLEEKFDNDITRCLGVNMEIMGRSENYATEQSAVLFKMRQSSGLVPMEFFFEGVRESQKILGELILELVRKNYLPEKVKKITGKEVPSEFYSQDSTEFGVVVEEGLVENTGSSFSQLMMLRQAGINISDKRIVESASLYEKKGILEDLEMAEKAKNEAQQHQMESEQSAQQALQESVLAKAESDKALASERAVRTLKTSEEIAGEAAKTQKTRAETVEKLTSAVKDLADTDTEKLEISMGIVDLLEKKERSEESSNEKTLINSQNETLPLSE